MVNVNPRLSPIVLAILEAERETTGEIRVHLSHRRLETNTFARAQTLFRRFGMTQTIHRNGVLLYVNLRRRRLAIIGDVGVHERVGQEYWENVIRELRENLRATQTERAIALAVRRIGETLAKFFPVVDGGPKPKDELPNEVTED